MSDRRALMALRNLTHDRNQLMGALSVPFSSANFQGVLRQVELEDISSPQPFNAAAPRSFASNLNMTNAGQSAATALEIVDSDEEDGDVMEVMTS